MKKLLNWLNSLTERHFDCEEDSLNEDYDSMEFHEWWKQFEDLKKGDRFYYENGPSTSSTAFTLSKEFSVMLFKNLKQLFFYKRK